MYPSSGLSQSLQNIGTPIRQQYPTGRSSHNILSLLETYGLPVCPQLPASKTLLSGIRVAFTFDRRLYLPMVQVLTTFPSGESDRMLATFQLTRNRAANCEIADFLAERFTYKNQRSRTVALLENLENIYLELKLRYLDAIITYDENHDLVVSESSFTLDDAAVKTEPSKYEHLARLAAKEGGKDDPKDIKEEEEAAEYGIVFIK